MLKILRFVRVLSKLLKALLSANAKCIHRVFKKIILTTIVKLAPVAGTSGGQKRNLNLLEYQAKGLLQVIARPRYCFN